MSLLPEIVEKIRRASQGQVEFDDSLLDDLYIENKIHTARAVRASDIYRTQRLSRVNESWLQTIPCSCLNSEHCAGVFVLDFPSVVRLDDRADGFFYVGKTDGLKQFTRITTGFTNLAQHSVFKNQGIRWDFTVDHTGQGKIKFYGNPMLEYAMVRAMVNDPTQVPNYRKDVDQYPVDAVLENDIVEMVSLDILKKSTLRPDVVSDSQDSKGIEQRIIKR